MANSVRSLEYAGALVWKLVDKLAYLAGRLHVREVPSNVMVELDQLCDTSKNCPNCTARES